MRENAKGDGAAEGAASPNRAQPQKQQQEKAGDRRASVVDQGHESANISAPYLPRALSMMGISVLPIAYCLLSMMFAEIVKPQEQTCNSEGCQATSEYIKRSIDERVRPCSDFYEFVCRGWEHWYTTDSSSTVTLVNLSAYMPSGTNHPPNIIKAISFHQSCEASFVGPVDSSIDDIKNFLINDLRFNWPTALPSMTTQEFYRILVEVQLSYLIHPFVVLNFDSGMTTMRLAIEDRYHPWYLRYTATANINFRWHLVNDVLSAVFQQTLPTRAVTDITDVEDKLSAVKTGDDELLVVRMRVLSQNSFRKGWELMHALGNYFGNAQKRLLSNKVVFRISDVAGLKTTLTYMNDASTLPAMTSYMVWVIIETLGRRTSPALRKVMTDPARSPKHTDVTDHIFRKDVCHYETYRLFALVLDRYMYQTFDKTTISDFEDIVGNAKRYMRAQLEDLHWMDAKTLREMQARIRHLVTEVGILSRFRYADVEEPYTRLPDIDSAISFTTLYVSVLDALSQSLRAKAYRYIYPRNMWSIVPTVRHVHSHNVLFIPLSVFMTPLFGTENFPTALIYGHLVTQITHAIYYEGYYSNKYRATESWNLPTERKFRMYMNCYNDAYSNVTYQLKDPAENFFRSGALVRAYQMFRTDQEGSSNYVLPAVELTPVQLFFVGSCLGLCVRNDEERVMSKALCNWPMRRTKIFQQAFKCYHTDALTQLRVNCSGLLKAISARYYNVSIETSFRCSDV
ncbi:membrane metallo-endopeptidase-like 1 [Dermacentor variabilis]|uniref:membrane metallo-endopeptidase-like 1 n=1 Tax=Dermacentor variabilis TaxID=34621 RepID=UPI003F5BB642